MMEREPKKPENSSKTPKMCKMNCGFYANPLFEELCNKCHEKGCGDTGYLGPRYVGHSYCSSNKSRSYKDEGLFSSDNDDCPSGECTCEQLDCSECFGNFHYDIAPSDISVEASAQEASISTNLTTTPLNGMSEAFNESIKQACKVEALPEESEPPPPNEPDDICYSCKKKLAFSGIKCKCQLYFCFSHRQPESHNCTYDYKDAGRVQIHKQNPKISLEKIRKF